LGLTLGKNVPAQIRLNFGGEGEEPGVINQQPDTLSHNNDQPPQVCVFDMLDCQQPSDFEKFIPGLHTATQSLYESPVLGVLIDGRTVKIVTGLLPVQEVLRQYNVLASPMVSP
jgi:hypothetical protein